MAQSWRQNWFWAYLISMLLVLSSCQKQPSENADPSYRVTVRNEGHQLKARYDLPNPTDALRLHDNDRQQREAAWTVADEAFTFDGVNIARKDGQKFNSVTFDLKRDPEFFNRRYVVIDEIGPRSWSVYFPAFAVEDENMGTDIVFENDDALTLRIGSELHSFSEPYRITDENILAYYGRPAYVKDDEAVIIAGPEIPQWFSEQVRRDVGHTMNVLETGFSVPASRRPTIYVTTGPIESGKHAKGGQLDEAVMTFRYRGYDLSQPDAALTEALTNTASHEATHLWIGGVYKNARNEEEPWMTEGGTEYLSDRTKNTTEDIKSELESRLNDCLKRIGNSPLDGSEGPVRGYHVYHCGYVLHAGAESAALGKSDANILDIWKHMIAGLQDANILDIWKHMIAGLKTDEKSYLPTDFLSSVNALGGPAYSEFARPFLEGGTSDRWQNLADVARPIGIELELSPDTYKNNTMQLIGQWLMPLLAQNCEGSHGFFNNDDAKVLHVKNCKPPFKDGMEVVSVNDISLIDDAFRAFNAVQTICDEQGELVFGLKNGEQLEPVKCEITVEPLPLAFKVVHIPDLPSVETNN